MNLLGARHVEAGFARKIDNIRTKATPPSCTWRWTACLISQG